MDPLAESDPRQLGPYKIIARLGSGGMGVVFLGSRGSARVAVKVMRSLSFEFLGGSADSWSHPPLYSMTNNNLSRFVCFPGDPYAEDNLQAWGRDALVRVLNPDGSAGEILAFSEPTGGCIVEAGKSLPIWEGQEGGGFRLRVTSDQLLSRINPGQCLNLRCDGGTGNSVNDVCVR